MGNILQGLSKRERRNIKMKKVDGTVMDLRGPAYVKEVVCDYPDHGVFKADSFRRPVDLSRHLPHNAKFRTGDLYLLIPLVSGENEGLYKEELMVDGVFKADSFRRPVDLSRHLPHTAKLRTGDLYLLIPLVSGENEGFCKEELMVDKTKSSIVSSKIVSACENGSTVRLTIRLSKKEAASLLGIDGKEIMKKLVPSFSLSTMERQQQRFSEWKPSLEPIAENHSSGLHRSIPTQT